MMQLQPTDIQDQGEMPPDIQELLDEIRAVKMVKIEAIGKSIAKLRDDAVAFRRQSGIEVIWQEDAEYYEGVDDANRDSHPWLKSASSIGGISRTPIKGDTRCRSFFNITRQFVDSASARMGDILLPAGDWNFAVKATPVQDDVEDENANTPIPQAAQPAQPAQVPTGQPQGPTDAVGQIAAMGQPAQPAPPPPITSPRQLEANKKAEKAELKIRDWLTECSFHTEERKQIESSTKLGTGVLKGPFPKKVKTRKASEVDGSMTMELSIETSPASKWVDLWDCFPDPACGDNIHNGNHFIERDRLTAKELRDLKGIKGYLQDQIDKVLEEGPGKRNISETGQKESDQNTKEEDLFEVWYFHGLIDIGSLDSMGVSAEGADLIPAVVTLVNDTPIQAFLNPLDTGEFPYDFMPWQPMANSPWGIGIARQVRTSQDMLNSAARALMDNAGLSSGPMIILREGAVRPADGEWKITPRKVWIATEQADVRSVADAFTTVNIPMVQNELSAIIQMAYKMAEDSTGMIYMMQGQQGSAPDTVGGMELLHRNASAPLRRQARIYDERVTEPHIRRYYEWLLLYGPEDCKGDLKIEAIGSTSLVERDIQATEAMVFLQMSANPIYGMDPESAAIEVLKSKRYNPEKWMYSPEKKAQMAQQPPPRVPAIEVAKIRAEQQEKDRELKQWQGKVDANLSLKATHDNLDRDRIYAEELAQRNRDNVRVRVEELQVKRDLAMLDYANKRNISLDQIKSSLAKESMRLRTQKELAGAETALTPQVAPTDMEPAGRAEAGKAFQQ